MEPRKFKTNAKCGGCVAAIGAKLNELITADQWRIDLSSPDKLLYVTADIPDEQIINAVSKAGFVATKR